MARVVQTVDEAVGGNRGVSATSDVLGGLWAWNSHALIKHKTFSLPVGCADFLVVIYNAAVELVNFTKPVTTEES